jgi:NAD-reducing hydrogenase large subunit
MGRTVVIDPVTRIEGHAKISLHLDGQGYLSDARFHVVEYRGFEKFCEGHPYTEMAGITARICGICPVSHLLAAAKTGDKLLAVQIPAAAVNLRRMLNLAQIGPDRPPKRRWPNAPPPPTGPRGWERAGTEPHG